MQAFRYGLVGIASNLVGYFTYLLMTWAWLEPKIAVSILYPTSALIAYFGHAKYSFSYTESDTYGLMRYMMAHSFGYVLNLIILYFFSDLMDYPHQWVQACAILIVSVFLFVTFKYFVFPKNWKLNK